MELLNHIDLELIKHAGRLWKYSVLITEEEMPTSTLLSDDRLWIRACSETIERVGFLVHIWTEAQRGTYTPRSWRTLPDEETKLRMTTVELITVLHTTF